MCDDGEHAHAADHSISRRGLLQGMVAVAALAACSPDDAARPRSQATSASPSTSPSPRPSPTPSPAGLQAYVLGMHLHASSSEGVGSYRSHLAQAAANGFDVAWFTEHDWRRRRMFYRRSYSFTPNEPQFGGTFTVEALPGAGALGGASGSSFVGSPLSPNDPAPSKGSLRLIATGTGADPGTVARRVRTNGTGRTNFRSGIAGAAISVDVLPASIGPDAWAEVGFDLSHHPAGRGRAEGMVSVLYRLRADVGSKSVRAEGTTVVVDVPVKPGSWQTVGFPLVDDVGRAFPDMDPRDNSLHEIYFRASGRRGATAEVFFGFLRFEDAAGFDGLGVERDLLERYADEVPDVLGIVGTEISLGPHMNQFGGPQDEYDYGQVSGLDHKPGDIRRSIADFIHRQGGLACLNHPSRPGIATQGSSPQAVARELLAIGAGGADMIEVGYGGGGSAGLQQQLAVWDTLARNGLFMTGNGVSDDHTGQNWASQPNRFYTGAWSTGLDERNLLGALGSGRVYVGYLGAFGGTIDMAVDEKVPMGAVSVSPLPRRNLRLDVTGLPQGGAVQVVRGAVDYGGPGDPNPNTAVVATLGASDLQRSPELAIDTAHDCFHRVQVVDSGGGIVAFGQPIWAFKNQPRTAVPARRRAPA